MSIKRAAIILISLLFLQLAYSFLFPSVGLNDNWQPISDYLPKFSAENSDNFILSKIYPLISSHYRLNSDVGHYMELGRYFSSEHFNGSPFLERPLYSSLIFLPSLITGIFVPTSYGVIFALSIFINFILISAAVVLFFYLLKKLFSPKVAWLSSILLIFSPFVHIYINQPLAEMLMAFAVVLAAYLLYNYAQKPSVLKLIIFSLIIGVLMLGKMFFAISLFILLMAIYFRRYKEGLAFLVVHLAPFLFWYLWVTRVWGISYHSLQVQDWDMGVWVLRMVYWPWQEIYRVFVTSVPDFIAAVIYGFILIPVIFSVIGWQKLPFKSKNMIYFGAILSLFVLGFMAKFYYIRHMFLLFPVVYPTAILGMERVAGHLRGYKSWLAPLFYVIVISLIILISNVDIHQVLDYTR